MGCGDQEETAGVAYHHGNGLGNGLGNAGSIRSSAGAVLAPPGENGVTVTIGPGEELPSVTGGGGGGGGGGGKEGLVYTSYPVEVCLPGEGSPYSSSHRYSEFRELHSQLRRRGHTQLPELPRRTLPFETPGGGFFEERRARLEAFVSELAAREACIQDPALKRFLNLPP